MSVTGTIRFLVGVGLVAAGCTLVAPLAARLAAAAREPAPPPAPGPGAGSAAGVPVVRSFPVPPVLAVPETESASMETPGALPGPALTNGGDWLQLDRSPPPPPPPLPPPPQELARANPAMGAAYRSTLDVPPPPLLDAAAPPPAVAWPVVAAAATAPAAAPYVEVAVPATYRIRDGDDLGSIAGRFYGQPAAASAIWAANRDTIPNPDLLPIGAELRLPPSWAVNGRARAAAGAIEPAAYVRPGPVAPASAEPAAPPWLAPAPVTSAPPASASMPAVTPSLAPQGRPAAAVVVGPGESLPALARRLYGDPAMADSIFAANRDRLRSPDLVVAGMELRLPGPVTAPIP